MTLTGWWLAIVAGIALAVVLEAWRRCRAVGRGGGRASRASGRPGLLDVGVLELQRHLQPDRKVEIVLQDARKEEHTEPGYRPGRVAGTVPERSAGSLSSPREIERPPEGR